MADYSLVPVAGINNVAEDAALRRGGDAPHLFVRDARNVNVTLAGKIELRQGSEQVTNVEYKNLWQSPLHDDLFGTLNGDLVLIDRAAWTHKVLAFIGEGDVSFIVLNANILVAGQEGLFVYNGDTTLRMTLDTPPYPFVMADDGGSLLPGDYGVAVSFLRGKLESALSEMTVVSLNELGALQVVLPTCADASVQGVRLYLTDPNGAEPRRVGDYSVGAQVRIPLITQLGAVSPFRHMDSMPTGKWLRYWRGRILTAKGRVLRFSEPLAYHVHDAQHGHIQFPQRITFVEPVDGGIWVGQVDHVLFLAGTALNGLAVVRKPTKPPVSGSSKLLPAEVAGGGEIAVVWLAENGFVGGTTDGGIREIHAGILKGIAGASGQTVVLDRRLLTALT